MKRNLPQFVLLFLVATSLNAQITFNDVAEGYMPTEGPTLVIHPTNFYISEPVRDMPQCIDTSIFDSKVVPKGNGEEVGPHPMSAKRQRKLAHLNSAGKSTIEIDPLIAGPETYTRASNDRAPIANFEGIGLNASPPDPSMAVGPNHVVTMENGLWSVYDKNGVQAAGFPKNLNNPLTGPNHGDNAGDPVVMYDRQADRWFLSQFQLSGNPALSDDVFLIGISQTADPTGAYYVYEYELTQGNDYPHYGVWRDSYVSAGNFTGAQKVYTFNRTKMLAGDGSAEIVGFSPSGLGSSGFAAPIPVHSERDVTPTGDIKIVFYQDDAFSGVTSDHIGLWNIDMDWSNIGSSTISGKNQIPTAAFDAAIAGGFSNLQQPGTSQRIDAIVGAVMNMVHWYEFGTHQSIVMNWVVEIQNGTQKSGIRWVEIRSTDNGATWSVYQEGTFTDPAHATVANKESVFMGCISMDEDGNIGLGYTKTGSSTFPSLYYTGRLASDALGTMSFGENLVISGTSSVTGNDRYGDYGQGVTDPSDDKTFWVTSEFSGDDDRRVRIYSYRIAAASPEISFGITSESVTESASACFTDIDVPLNIALAPSQDATVDFTINGTSTASTNVDFELLTSSVTFLAGQTTGQTMTVRVYHDGLVEVNENLIIDFTVTTTGDATANTAANTYTMTIVSTDVAPTPTTNVTVLDADFETVPAGWLVSDQDGDGVNWSIGIPPGPPAHLTTQKLFSQSWNGAALTPDNYIITNQVMIPADVSSATLTYEVAPATLTDSWYEEYYTVYWTTSIATIGAITGSAQVKPGGIISQAVVNETIDMTPYVGQAGYLVFRHHNCTDEEYISIDNILLEGEASTNVQTAVNTGTADQLNIDGVGTAYAYDLSTDDVMASVVNNQADDYGCSTMAVSRAGTSAQGYNGSTGADRVTDKTFTVTTSNTIGSGDTSITFYFTEAEIAGWEGLTGLDRNTDLIIGRGNATSISETSTTTIGAFGTGNITVTGNFSGLDGTYYFGSAGSFVASCSGGTKTWNGTNWSPAGAPDNTHNVVFTGNYSTGANGLEACTITVAGGAILTVNALGYARAQGDITVDGTLIVAHQGSIVQVDPSAVVTKTGTINVEVTTPVLQTRDFMVMGSPMDDETRNGVFSSAFLVLDHDPDMFNPNTHPNIPQGATNFKDLEGDYWSIYSGDINPGEGYIVRPQSGYGDPANTTFDMTYAAGTLNNGTVNRPMIYNSTNSPAGTPNTYSNPYASAIDADKFIQDNGLNALYFWEHLTPPTVIVPGESIMFDMDDVSVRNFGGGVAANNDNPANIPNGVISTGQGFAIKATSNGSVNFTNDMRLTTGNTTLRSNELEVDRLWLHLESNTYGLANNLLIGFNPAATDGWDNGYDTDRLASSVGLYSHLDVGTGTGEEQMAIQTRGAFQSSEKIHVGFSSLIEEHTLYTISLSNYEGSNLSDTSIYLYDSHMNVMTDLTQGDYEFRSSKATNNRRFTVSFEPDNVLATGAAALENITMFPNPTDGVLNITAPDTTIETIKIYDVRGRVIAETATGDVSYFQIDMATLKTSMYFVEISTPDGKITKRIVKK
ncbi:T9SS type A sorting domain-containing protein [Rasiella rasia]|uniref:T9SS type A sorting domain-containing protein n=1 Tax=Rasiella rasia TaxID=2744027 RepID=A0A6G6GPH4_9FLAO|nr:choice-of-anchor J domain-containing protein [Rasiella rasia]QIE60448.1 T9SS type A sorting domain-containing protein [Rasiella rasia]